MRIVGGRLRGRALAGPKSPAIRPTADRLRETLFNILAPRIAGARVVDAYAGTGAVGIEALSRGARDVTFVEQDRRAQALIAENLAHCGVTTGYTIVRAGALRAFQSSANDAPYDIILRDPPYAVTDAELAAVLAAAGERVSATGVVVLERGRRRSAPDASGRLTRSRDVASGSSALTLYEVKRQKEEGKSEVR
jgi:16S rRNA (guanine966-N2)-methyltransferase